MACNSMMMTASLVIKKDKKKVLTLFLSCDIIDVDGDNIHAISSHGILKNRRLK